MADRTGACQKDGKSFGGCLRLGEKIWRHKSLLACSRPTPVARPSADVEAERASSERVPGFRRNCLPVPCGDTGAEASVAVVLAIFCMTNVEIDHRPQLLPSRRFQPE
jgi:hypothetical protein